MTGTDDSPFGSRPLSIGPLHPERQLDGYLRVMHQVDPSPRSPAEWWERQRLAAPGAFRRYLVAEHAGEIVAAAALLDHEMLANTVAARLVVDEVHRGRGVGRAMAAAVEAVLAERAPAALEVRVRDDDPGSRAWAERRGFRLHDHAIRSRLDLVEFDPASHRQAVARAAAAGLRVEEPADLDRLYDLYVRAFAGVPAGLRPPGRDSFRSQMQDRPGVVKLVARDEVAWVGLTLATPSEPDGAWNYFTGVLPEHRGRGIATALKVALSEELVRQGRRWVETTNQAIPTPRNPHPTTAISWGPRGNAAMLAVNRALGYRPVAGVLFLRRGAEENHPG